jgi:hypothetical protein
MQVRDGNPTLVDIEPGGFEPFLFDSRDDGVNGIQSSRNDHTTLGVEDCNGKSIAHGQGVDVAVNCACVGTDGSHAGRTKEVGSQNARPLDDEFQGGVETEGSGDS